MYLQNNASEKLQLLVVTRNLQISLFALIEFSAAKSDTLQATTIPVGFASYVRIFRAETHAFVYFIVRKDIFTREKTAQDEERIGSRNKHWTSLE